MGMEQDDAAGPEFGGRKKKPLTDEEKRKKKITPGSLMKAIIRPGEGTAKPADGHQVIVHCTVRTLDGVVVESTRLDYGGEGKPKKYVLGKSKMLLGLLEGIPTMLKGEVAMLKMKPELHYGEDDCPVKAPDAFPRDDELHFEIEMIDFFKIKVISEDLGVLKKVIREGEGWESPREPYEVKLWIAAKKNDGTVIFSHTEGEPFFFTLGKNEVPKGLEMGLGTMTRGEKAMIYVSSTYLSNSSLIPMVDGVNEIEFEVEIIHFIQVRDMLGDGRLIKRRIVDGEGFHHANVFIMNNEFCCRCFLPIMTASLFYITWSNVASAYIYFLSGEFPMDCPLHDSLLRVHYKGYLLNKDKTVFYDTRTDNDGEPLEFSSGEGLVPEGFEMCVRLMLPGEKALVTCPPDYAYDKFPRPPNVPEGAHVQWEIELLGFEMPKDWTGLNFQSIMDEADKIKNTGNRLFKEGKFELAKAKYEKVLREYNHVNPQDDEEGKIFLNSRNSLHLNVAACFNKLGEHRKSIETCNKVLDASPAHVKALYRRGMAYMSAGDFEEAGNDFKKMITLDKSSETDATAALNKLRQMELDVEKRARRQFKGLFDKKPGEIADVSIDDKEGDGAKSDEPKEEAIIGEEEASERDAEPAPAVGRISHFWSSGRRFLSTFGLQRCSIL